jgi:hypothetical protein
LGVKGDAAQGNLAFKKGILRAARAACKSLFLQLQFRFFQGYICFLEQLSPPQILQGKKELQHRCSIPIALNSRAAADCANELCIAGCYYTILHK